VSRIDHVTAQNLAIELLKRAGFILDHVALASESCYYYHPAIGKKRLVRVSTHRGKGRTIGKNGVVSKVTCGPRNMHATNKTIENQVIYAIGHYFLTEPKPSEYRGKRGTWENGVTPQIDFSP
jgi:hypothetical protein